MPYHMSGIPDLSLLDGVAHGDDAALRELEQRHGNTLYALAYGLLVDALEADAVVAETFAYARRSAARFVDAANRSVAGWLKDIARSQIRALLAAREWPERLTPAHARGADFVSRREVRA